MLRNLSIVFLLTLLQDVAPALDVGSKTNEALSQGGFEYLQSGGAAVREFKNIEWVALSRVKEFNRPPMLLAARQAGNLLAHYGVLDGVPPNAYFLYDTDGDGVLDMKTQAQKFPPWILFEAEIPRQSADSFVNDCGRIYGQFNSVRGPQSWLMNEDLKRIADHVLNEAAEDRDIYYALLFYSSYSMKDPQFCLGTIRSLETYLLRRYKVKVPLVQLYTGETLINLGRLQEAKTIFSELKSLDKRSFIAEFYLARLDIDITGDSRRMEDFKENYSEFWTLTK